LFIKKSFKSHYS